MLDALSRWTGSQVRRERGQSELFGQALLHKAPAAAVFDPPAGKLKGVSAPRLTRMRAHRVHARRWRRGAAPDSVRR